MRIKNCTDFSQVIAYHRKENPERVFIRDIASSREYTFGEFDLLVNKTSMYLRSLGIGPGDFVTVVIENSPEYCFFYFAVIRVGAVMNPMPFGSHRHEIEKNIKMVNPRMIFVDQHRQRDFPPNELPENMVFVPVGKNRIFEGELDPFSGEPQEGFIGSEFDPACLYYSSGTTSDPKGVLFSHRNMISNISSICRGFRFKDEGEVHLVILPLGHTASTNYSMLPCAYMGGTIVMAESFWKIRNDIWDLIEKYRVTYIEVVPTILYTMLNIYKERIDCDLLSLPFVGCGSAPLQTSIQQEFFNRFRLKVANLYGLSETGPTHFDDPLDPDWVPGSIGVPLDVNEVKIFGSNGEETADGEMGEIVIRGDNVFVGYHNNEDAYRQAVRNGYFHTGDLGYRHENGLFYYVDRKKDLIIKGGINIVPGEIDEVLMKHPAVMESVTVGVPDEMFGEEIQCFVTLREGVSATSDEIFNHCTGYLSGIRIPKSVEIVTEIPKTHSGKLLRRSFRSPEGDGR